MHSITILHNDGLPQSACRSCIKTITRALDLRELSSKVDQMLRTIVKRDTVIKIEQNDFIDNDFDDNDMPNTKNTVSNSIRGSSKMSNDNLASKHNVTLRNHQYEYEKLNETKESHQIDIDKSYNNVTLDIEEHIDVKPKLKKRNDEKIKINIKSANFRKETRNYKGMDNDSSSDDGMPLAAYEGTADAKPLINNHEFKEENGDELSSENSSDSKDSTNLNFESIFTDINKTKAVSNRNVRPNINNKTNTDEKPRKTDSTNKNNRFMKSNCNNNIFEENTIDSDTASGKLCNIRLEDYISSQDIDELFDDVDIFEKYYGKAPIRPLARPREDQNGPESKIMRPNNVDEKKAYNNYFVHMMMRKNSSHETPLMIPKNNKMRKNKFFDEREIKWNSDRKMVQLNEKHQKLLSLAVTPYHPKGPVQCKLCHRRLQTVANFRSHAKTHFEPEFTCELQNCGKRFNSRNHMYYHQQRRHGREKRLACPQCEFRAVDRLALRNHERAEHTGERPYVCNECGAAFRMRNNIIQHMTIHFGVRNVQCELCPALFTRRSQLWTHQNSVHFLTYTYHCYLCPETYKGLAPVKKHLLAIHGVPQDQQLKIQCVKTRKNDAANTSGLISEFPQNHNFCHR